MCTSTIFRNHAHSSQCWDNHKLYLFFFGVTERLGKHDPFLIIRAASDQAWLSGETSCTSKVACLRGFIYFHVGENPRRSEKWVPNWMQGDLPATTGMNYPPWSRWFLPFYDQVKSPEVGEKSTATMGWVFSPFLDFGSEGLKSWQGRSVWNCGKN